MKKIDYQDFNVETVSLKGVKLIEASAGTGKTYSIAILVLRALLETDKMIPQLLIMTFTKDAVAELQERISKFLYIAQNIVNDGLVADKMIEHLVKKAIQSKGKETVKELITNNILLIDEANIVTIHGFCQKILGEFAMDTLQPFSSDLVTETEPIVNEQIQLFWRNYITTAPINLQVNFDEKFYKAISELVKFSLSDKPLYNMDLDTVYTFPSLSDDTEWTEEIRFQIQCFAIQEITKKIKQYFFDNNLLTYDDLIANLHKAVTNDRENVLSQKIAEKLPIVFIDEFQDTDKMQYEIFKHVFQPFAECLFYIGDPKQSIYAFRKADLYTYFQARESADEVFSMNTNYRSNPTFLQAVNSFFQPVPQINAFGFDNGAEAIDYIPVKFPDGKSDVWRIYDKSTQVATTDLNIRINKNGGLSVVDLVTTIQQFLALESPYYLQNETGHTRAINAADIAILVKSNDDGKSLTNELSKIGIKTVSYQNAKIQKSTEMKSILYLLEAMANPTIGNIHKVLLDKILNYKIADIEQLNIEEAVYTFKQLYDTWTRNGILAAIEKLLNIFAVYERLPSMPNGDRILANIIQINEILNKQEKQMNSDPEALLEWFQYNIKNEKSISFEAEQRIESDEDAVRILTVHKSKGLEFNIVLCYNLVGTKSLANHINIFSFRDDTNGNYYASEKAILKTDARIEKLRETETDQENLRKLYVAITRAKIKCILFCSQSAIGKKSINRFLAHKAFFEENISVDLIDEKDAPTIVKRIKLASQKNQISLQPLIPLPNIKINDLHWHRVSYSGLSAHEGYINRPRNYDLLDNYDKFIFNQLPSGTLTGTFLHDILEKVDFQNDQSWNYLITKMTRKYYPDKVENEEFATFIFQMLAQVTQAIIPFESTPFSLNQVSKSKRLAELQFDFPLDQFKISKINQLYKNDDRVIHANYNDNAPIEGMMNGFIDLLFEHNHKFYILDWKSNYLGFEQEHYNTAAVKSAMDDQNYHLQYMIYCVAANLFLSSRIPNFNFEQQFGGVAYYFLRGVRAAQTSGIYTYQPSLKEVNQLANILLEKTESLI